MTHTIAKTTNRPNLLILSIQWLLGLAVAGALVHAVYLSIVAGTVDTGAFHMVFTALISFALTLIPSVIIRLKILPMPAILHTVYTVFVYLARG